MALRGEAGVLGTAAWALYTLLVLPAQLTSQEFKTDVIGISEDPAVVNGDRSGRSAGLKGGAQAADAVVVRGGTTTAQVVLTTVLLLAPWHQSESPRADCGRHRGLSAMGGDGGFLTRHQTLTRPPPARASPLHKPGVARHVSRAVHPN